MSPSSGSCDSRGAGGDNRRMSTIRALSIDLDNTLWDVEPVIAQAERILHAHLHERYPRMTERHGIAEMRVLRMQMAETYPSWKRRSGKIHGS
jgi:hypothetical protein